MAKRRTPTQAAKDAARAHSDLTTFAGVQAILEVGCIYRSTAYPAVQRIIKICNDEGQKALREYDRALALIAQEKGND